MMLDIERIVIAVMIFTTLIYLSLSFVFCKNALHMFQQNRYELYRYSKWLFNRNNLHYSPVLVYLAFVILMSLFIRKNPLVFEMLILMATVGFAIYLLIRETRKVYIKDLNITARVVRQIIFMFILMAIFMYAVLLIMPLWVASVCAVYMPYLMIYVMAILTMPIENRVKKYYENEARNILSSSKNLLTIGITGSYGKTSTKNIISDIIDDDFYTLITPASYNTPMGITRTVREMLKPTHEVFVCEMGADKVNDISYLMDFVKPRFGVVTSIGKQHLNTFHSLENIIAEKMKEIEMLPSDGVGFINVDNEHIRNYKINNDCRIITVGTDDTVADYVAKKIKYTKDGSQFTVRIKGKDYRFTTSLLGRHNIGNIMLGIAIGLELGIDIKKIVRNVENIRQIEHRLEVKNINGYTFIDDAFNANPVGSKQSLDVLSLMPGNRIIVTPGMIDLGSEEDETNRDFGRYMKGKADHVVLVGQKQTTTIYEGLEESGFDMNNVIVCKNINEAFSYLYSHFSKNDTILLENDLPDAFNV